MDAFLKRFFGSVLIYFTEVLHTIYLKNNRNSGTKHCTVNNRVMVKETKDGR